MTTIDEITMLRFASGELDTDTESTFLAQCELSPAAWRATVLAVAEYHRLAAALRELAADDMPTPATMQTPRARPWRWLPVTAAALAAAIAIGSLVTFFSGPRQNQVVQTPPVPSQRPECTPTDVARANTLDSAPILSPKQPHSSDPPPALLADHGIEVEDEPTVYVVATADGTRWAVPTQRTVYHFVKR